MAERYQQIL